MKNDNWLNYKIQVRDRLRLFALRILELSELIPKTERGNIVNHQITKSGTSAYANFCAALRGRSKKEFYAKLSISVEEADETEMWLDLIVTLNLIKSGIAKELHTESLELLKLLSSMRKRSSD